MDREVETTSHPVEKGVPTADTVMARATSISISGKIVDYGEMTVAEVIAKLKSLHASGSLIQYMGRNVASSMQIQSFSTNWRNRGDADFSMSLKEVRIAKSAYTPQTATEEQQTAAKANPVLEVGAIVVFKGGAVYASSDATKSSATRGRSTCEITKISTLSYSMHPYHLISTDGGNVYGWVDKELIEGSEQTSTNGTTNAGTQQVKTGTKTAVYHTVKSGDTVWKLVNTSYKDLGTDCDWVVDNNPDCFSRKGDAATLKVGSKLLMGYR